MTTLGTGSENTFDLEVDGTYYWEMLFDIDNSNNSGTIKREVQVVTDVSMSYENMVRSLETESTSASLGFDLGGVLFDVVKVGVKGDLSYEVKSEYENMTTTKKDYRKTTTKTDTFEVGPHSTLKMYRLAFKGPGVNYLTDTLSTNTTDMPAVPIAIQVQLIEVLKDVEVVATEDSASRPDDLIKEAKNLNPDINSGFGGKYVWLRAVWTRNVDEGATGIQIAVQPQENQDYVDMAAGAGGDYRYVKMLRDPHSKQRITKVDLWRVNDDPPTLPTEGEKYQFMTDDINKGRRGDYLYLCWNVLHVANNGHTLMEKLIIPGALTVVVVPWFVLLGCIPFQIDAFYFVPSKVVRPGVASRNGLEFSSDQSFCWVSLKHRGSFIRGELQYWIFYILRVIIKVALVPTFLHKKELYEKL